MSKSSFTVRYHLPKYRKTVVVLGVTSIYPNLNGFLFCTEDGKNHQVESHELDDKMLTGMSFEYDTSDEDIEFDFKQAQQSESQFQLIDGRNGYYDYSDLLNK